MQRESYLMVDHRASPGLPEDVSRAMGFDPNLTREGKLFEAASLTCSHCKTAVIKNPFRTRERERCSKCDHYICDFCSAEMRKPDYVHTPFEAVVEQRAHMIANGTLGSAPSLILP